MDSPTDVEIPHESLETERDYLDMAALDFSKDIQSHGNGPSDPAFEVVPAISGQRTQRALMFPSEDTPVRDVNSKQRAKKKPPTKNTT